MQRTMEILTRRLGQVEILDVIGRGDVHTQKLLRETVRRAIHCGRSSFVLNLIHISFLDSLMIGELVACLKRARECGGDVKLVVSPGSVVHQLLELTRLDAVFQIFGDEDEAIARA